jgi:hypothetical protein
MYPHDVGTNTCICTTVEHVRLAYYDIIFPCLNTPWSFEKARIVHSSLCVVMNNLIMFSDHA